MSPLLLLVLVLGLLLVWILRGRKRRDGEPPLIKGWIPYLGKALEFGKDPYTFLEEQRKRFGDVFMVLIAGKYMTFIMDPFMYPSIAKQGGKLDFHEFTDMTAPVVFAYPRLRSKNTPGLEDGIARAFKLLQGDDLNSLTESMMGNLVLLFRQDHLGEVPSGAGGWRSGSLYKFCDSVMFEATFLTIYGRPASGSRHREMDKLREEFVRFDSMFPLLVAKVPIRFLRRAKESRDKLIDYFLPHRMSCWSNSSRFIQRRVKLLEQQSTLTDVNRAGHHFAILWASVANTVPASFWALYFLASHPDALDVIRREILDVLKLSGFDLKRGKELNFRRDQLDQLLYMESCINESLRLCSASMNIRVAQEAFSLRLDKERSVTLRKGDIIILYPQSLHLDPEIYEEPQTFRFDRFIQNHQRKTDFYKNGQKLKYYHMPFGSGASMCPGRYFAMNEIKQFLCMVLLYFDLELEEGQARATTDNGRAGLGMLLPKRDVLFRYRLRTL